jgi:hypothetical protein
MGPKAWAGLCTCGPLHDEPVTPFTRHPFHQAHGRRAISISSLVRRRQERSTSSGGGRHHDTRPAARAASRRPGPGSAARAGAQGTAPARQQPDASTWGAGPSRQGQPSLNLERLVVIRPYFVKTVIAIYEIYGQFTTMQM